MSKRFKTQDYARFKKLGTRWRKPSGRQSKLRVKKAGSGLLVKIGYGTSKALRGKIQNMDVRLIDNADKLDGSKAVIISGAVGLKKAKIILERAEKLGIKVLNKRRIKDGLALRERAKAQKEKASSEKKDVKEKAEKEAAKEIKTVPVAEPKENSTASK